MSQSLSYLIQRLKPYWLSVASSVAAIEINKIIYFPIAGPAVFYEKTAANLTIALAGAATGEVVMINGPCTLTDDFTVPDGVALVGKSMFEVILEGQITLGEEASVSMLTIENTANSGTVVGVEAPVTGSGYVLECNIVVNNTGNGGSAFAVSAASALIAGEGDLYVYKSILSANAQFGTSYCGRSTAGRLYIYHTDADDWGNGPWYIA